MAAEAVVQRVVWMALGRLRRCTLFRTNSGKAWLSGAGPVKRLTDGSVLVPAARPVALGLALVNGDTVPGLSDLTGYTLIDITSEMVGRRLPIFTVIETKETGGGQKRKDQIEFVQQMQSVGAIAGFAASEQQAIEIIDAWLARRTPELM